MWRWLLIGLALAPSAANADTDETDVFELSVGTRQTFFLDSRFQPYVGVGGALFKTHNSDHYTGEDPDSAIPPDPLLPVDQTKHFQTVAWGLYLRTGFVWNVLRDQLREDSEFQLGCDVRGLVGDEFSFVEFSLVFGYGR